MWNNIETENLVPKLLFEIGNIICIKYPHHEFFKIELYFSNFKQLFRNFCTFNKAFEINSATWFCFNSLAPSKLLFSATMKRLVIWKTLIKTIWIILRNEEIEKRKNILRRNASQIMGESNLVCIDLGTDSLKKSCVCMA